MKNVKYYSLVNVEGEFPYLFKTEQEMVDWLNNYAKQEKIRGVENTDKWLTEMLKNGYSQIYSNYPDTIIIFDYQANEN
jgi:hypothetical protein